MILPQIDQDFNQQVLYNENKSQLFISDFPEQVSLDNIISFFGDFADKIVNIIPNKSRKPFDTHSSKTGNAVVQFTDPLTAKEAILRFNLRKIAGKSVRVMWHDNDHSNRYNPEGNLFIKNIPFEVTPREFYEFFCNFGEIVSAKINEDEEGKHCGYGYIHYLEPKNAFVAQENTDGKVIWGDTPLEVKNFQKKNERATYEINKNIYIKGIPNEFTEKEVNEIFEKFGKISFSKVITDNITNKKFAILTYENDDSIQLAIKNTNGLVVNGNTLYVNLLMKKNERQRVISNTISENNFRNSSDTQFCNLHIRNLPYSVKEDELFENFKECGEIKSVKIAKMVLVTKEKNVIVETETSKGFGYVCFLSQQSAKFAIDNFNGKFLKGYETWKRPMIIEYFMPKYERKNLLNKMQNQQYQQTQNESLFESYGKNQQQSIRNQRQIQPGFGQNFEQKGNFNAFSQINQFGLQPAISQNYGNDEVNGNPNYNPRMNYQGQQQFNQGFNNPQQLNPYQNQNRYQMKQNPYQGQQNPYQGQQNPYQGQQNPYQNQQNPYQNQQNPYLGQQNPYLGQQNPYQGQQNPYTSQLNPYQGQQNITQNPHNIYQNPYPNQTSTFDNQNLMAQQFDQGNRKVNNNKNINQQIYNQNQGINNRSITNDIYSQSQLNSQIPQQNYKVPLDQDPEYDFLKLEDEEGKREYLGELIFKKIENHPLALAKQFPIDLIGKITGMILGIEDINEIAEISRNQNILTNRIQEALELMDSNN